MGVFDNPSWSGHQQVAYCRQEALGLSAIIAIHDTTLGPAIGGCRMAPYTSEEDALSDALRLSRAMTYKAACANVNLGGGTAVIIGDPAVHKSEGLLRAFGQFIESLNGRFIASTDMGTASDDMDVVNMETDHVCGVGQHYGGSGDPSPVCAWGVFYAIRASVAKLQGEAGLSGQRVAVQGCGSVGYHVCRYLNDEGAELVVADLDPAAADRVKNEFGATIVAPESIYSQEADIFSPCAVGGVLNPETIGQLNARIVCGSANNQLADEIRDAKTLHDNGILYAPDFVVNAGGLISVYTEIHAAPREKAMRDTEMIGTTLGRIIDLAWQDGLHMNAAANRVAEQRIQDLSPLGNFQLGPLE